MKTYLIQRKKDGIVMATSIVTENDWDDPELTEQDIIEDRVESAIEDGYLEDCEYEIKDGDKLFGNEKGYQSFVKEMKERWKGEFVEI